MDEKKLLFLLIVLLVCVHSSLSQSSRRNNLLRILHQWKFANFDYNSTHDRLNAEKLGYLTPGNVAILDADYYIDLNTQRRRIFVTTPLFLPGIPATFSEVLDEKRDDPVMRPFPSWDAQNTVSCRGPISVYRVFIDRCGLLWVLDSGMMETFLISRRACTPKILIYDLNKNDELVARYDFPAGVVNERSILITLVTESYRDDCRDSIAYIADVETRGLIVFDFSKRNSWRVEHPYFSPFPDHGVVRIKETTIQLMDGLFGLALSPSNDRRRKLYFHSAASVRESWVLTSVLKNATIVNNADILRHEFHHSEDVREGQSTVEVMTEDGILIYPVLNKNALACWNSAQPLEKKFQYTIYEDADNLQFISGMKLKNKTLMITSSKLQKYLLFQANGTDIKYRVMVIDDVDRLLDGTPCRKGQKKPVASRPPAAAAVGWTERYHTTSYRSTSTTRQQQSDNQGDQIDHKQTAVHFGAPPHKPSSHEPPSTHEHTTIAGHPPYWRSSFHHDPLKQHTLHEKSTLKTPPSLKEARANNHHPIPSESDHHFPHFYFF